MKEIVNIKQDLELQENTIKSDLFIRWINYIDAKPKTVQTYTRAIKQFLFYMKKNDIIKPTRDDVINYRDILLEEHKPTTVNSYLMAVKQFFHWTAQEGIYPDIAAHIKGVKLSNNFKKDYLTAGQVKKVLNHIDKGTKAGKRDFALIALMITTGLRTIEVARANIEDLRNVADFTALYIQGKGRDEREEFVKIEPIVEDAIREYLGSRGKYNGKDALFASIANRNNDSRMTTRSISRIVKTRLQESGFNSDRITAHSLRHTAATLNLLNGGTVEETQQLLRHKNINTTLIYSHALERASNKSEQRIANAIF